ncbi:MAG TPA: YqhA family protein [Anaerolineales bacterium]|nr:YqhA family protein [Anaerolineales bacterium]
MKTIIGQSRYLALVAVVTLLLTFFLALLWGVGRAVTAGQEIITSLGQSSSISLYLIKVVDAFLIAIVLYMLAASIYSLFVEKTGLPSRLVADDLPELKSKLSGVIVLVLAVRFAEALFEEVLPASDILWLGLAVAAVAAMLIAFGFFVGGDQKPRGLRH